MTHSRKKKPISRSAGKASSTDTDRQNEGSIEIPGGEVSLSELAQRLIEEVQRIKNSNEHVANRIDALEDEVDSLILKMRGMVDSIDLDGNINIRQKVADRLYRRIGDLLETTGESEVFRKIAGAEAEVEKHLLEIRNLVEHFRRKERDLVSVLIINRFTKTVDSAFTLSRRRSE